MVTPKLDNVADVYVLSPMQQGMLFHTISEPDSDVYVNQISFSIRGDIHVEAFKTAWRALIDRHETLRTAFLWDGLDEPLQVVRERAELNWHFEDWSDLDDKVSRLDALIEDDRNRAFDLSTAPVTRMSLVRMGRESWQWIWTFHHLVMDGWSAQVLLTELQALYEAEVTGNEVDLDETFPYREYIAWVSGRASSSDEAFWRSKLAGFATPQRIEVPGLEPAPGAVGYETLDFQVGEDITSGLKDLSTRNRVTLNATVSAAWSLVLSRWARESDIVFGVTTSGRPADLEGIEHAVGLFVNTVPIRLNVDSSLTVSDWLQVLHQEHLEIREHEHVSLASIQRWCDVPTGAPLFESLFVFENYPAAGETQPGRIQIDDVRYIERSNYPLAVLAIPGEKLTLSFVFDRSKLSHDAIHSLAGQLEQVLKQFTANPEVSLRSISLAPGENAELLELGTGPDMPTEARSIHELVEETAKRAPGAPAVISGGSRTTYAELDELSDRVSARLRESGVVANTPVGLYVDRSAEMIIGILAILKAGGAYVPLDPTYPDNHIRALLEDDEIAIVLTDRTDPGQVPTSAKVLTIEEAARAEPGEPASVAPDDLAYVIHTSGSTGKPKGVMVTHRNLVHSTLARTEHYGEPVGRFLLLSSFAFDSSVAGIFWTLCTGGALVLPEPGAERDLDSLLSLAAEHGVTHLLGLPALYELMLESAADAELANLRVAIVAGEACSAGVIDAHFDKVPGAELHNEYGPTEATVWSTVHRMDPTDREPPVPIGRPIAGTSVRVLDSDRNATPIGFAGELWIAGPGVASGYLGRPDLTSESFDELVFNGSKRRSYRTGDLVAFRGDGALLFLGRADSQVKIRGHRIETGAVEAAIRSHETVLEAAVATHPAPGNRGLRLIGYAVPDKRGEQSLQGVRDELKRSLPEFMIPDLVIPVEGLPRLPNGKVDMNALPDPESMIGERDEPIRRPTTENERKLADIWVDLLGLEDVSVDDDYFALGGDSIISIQMISRARQAGLHLEPAQVASHPTIAELAAAASAGSSESSTSQAPVTGDVPLSPAQLWLLSKDLHNPDHWNQSVMFELGDSVDAGTLQAALEACVAKHDMLRARFEMSDGEWAQLIEPPGRLILTETTAHTEEDLEEILRASQGSLDLTTGVFKPVFIRRPGSNPLLLMVAHHLAVDVVSWATILSDVELAYTRLEGGDPPELGARSDSFAAWVEELDNHDRSGELSFWLAHTPPAPLHDGQFGYEASTGSVEAELEPGETVDLLGRANEAYHTTPQELLVAALAFTLRAAQEDDQVFLTLEGHGRSSGSGGLDVSGTVGWFTALYPLRVDLPAEVEDGYLIKTVKETIRSVPDGGIGFGVLRHLKGEPALSKRALPPVVFNYLGRTSLATNLLQPARSVADSSRAPENPRLHMWEIVAGVEDSRLVVNWQYSSEVTSEQRVRELSKVFVENLRALVAHCLSEDAGGFTPSDFPDAGLGQEELDAFLEELG